MTRNTPAAFRFATLFAAVFLADLDQRIETLTASRALLNTLLSATEQADAAA